jgi:hypothetical protein
MEANLIQNKNVDTAVKTIGKIATDAIKDIPDPFLKAVIAVIGIFDIPAFVAIIALAVIYRSQASSASYSFMSLIIYFVINFSVLLILLLKREVKKAVVNAAAASYDSAISINTKPQ